MQASQIKNEDGLQTAYGMGIPNEIDTTEIKRIYFKILYLPSAFGENRIYHDTFNYIKRDTENEIAKISFPLLLMKRGAKNE
nr:hypothetical protein [Mammaliicoccus sp. Marseille-Q6498]